LSFGGLSGKLEKAKILPMIKAVSVTKSFGEVSALEDVSFEVEEGEFVFVMGPSGAGKTTLLKLLLREYLPDKGQILFDKVDITQIPNKEIPSFRQKIGVVFQDYKLLPERTVRENVEVPLAVIKVPRGEWGARVDTILSLVGLSKKAEMFPSQLSGGELQRVSLARALIVNPKLVMADEPTGNLDWDTAEDIVELFEKINKEGKTVIMATHNKTIVDKLRKRVIELKDGKIVKGKTKEETK
jgi:cell division transport system ATP-binding protein